MESKRVLYRPARLVSWHIGQKTYVVRSGPFLLAGCMYGTIAIVMALCDILAALFFQEMIGKNAIAACFAATLFLVVVLTSILGAMATLQHVFPRRWEFRSESATCVFRNVPGFRLHFPFSEIQHVDLLITRNGVVGWVALTLRDSRRPYIVCGIRTLHWPRETVFGPLAAVAEELSRTLRRPVRHRVVSLWFTYMFRCW